MSDLPEVIASVAGALGQAHVEALAEAYGSSGVDPDKVRQSVPAPHRHEVDRLNQAWAGHPEVAGSAIALALGAVRSAQRTADLPRVEVVVTGPDSPAAAVRLTSEVVRQLIDQAHQRVTLVSYAAYQLPAIIAALDAAVGRGVYVSLIVESPEKLVGGGGAAAYERFRVYHWPIDRRDPPDAKLHAKAVIVDGRDVLLTSANMTNAAYDKNIELGVLCRGGGVARQVQRHFDGLISAGILE